MESRAFAGVENNRSKFGSPQKTLNDPMKYIDLSYYDKAFGKR